MNEFKSDNNPVGVKYSVNIGGEDIRPIDFAETGNDDFFVCRKCNKIFNNLSDYVEHKVKEDDFRIGQVRSKKDHRFILPQLVQRKSYKKIKLGKRAFQAKSVNNRRTVTRVAETNKEEGRNCFDGSEGTDHTQDATQASSSSSKVIKENSYQCKKCSKTFRREATLRWHMQRNHKEQDLSGDNSDSSGENGFSQEASAEDDEDFSIGFKDTKKVAKEVQKENPGAREIHIVIEEKSGDVDNDDAKTDPKNIDGIDGGTSAKKRKTKSIKPDTGEAQPFTCGVCGRTFKELAILKAHGLVHTEQRNFHCTQPDCPYAFKTKGGLTRHMRRHTGDRPFHCERCGRSFAESGALTRHMKARRNCASLTNKAYPRYMKSWTYHPNIPAVVDPAKRDPYQGRNTWAGLGLVELPVSPQNRAGNITLDTGEEIHYIIADLLDDPVSVDDASADMPLIPTAAGVSSGKALAISPAAIKVSDNTSGDHGNQEIGSEEKALKPQAANTGVSQMATLSTNSVSQAPPQIITVQTVLSSASTQGEPVDGSGKDVSTLLQNVVSQTSTVGAQRLPAASLLGGNKDVVSNSAVIPDINRSATYTSLPISQNNFSDLGDGVPELKTGSFKKTHCHVCKKEFEAVEGLEIHLRTHLADESSRCGLCHFTARGREELRQHILTMHLESLNDIEASVLAMEVEEATLKKGETVKDRKFSVRTALIAVKQLFSLKKQKNPEMGLSATGSAQCMVCNKFFRGSGYLRQHMRTHTGERPHQCQHCGRCFTSRDILKKHAYVHLQTKNYRCGECGKLFKRLGHVQQHLRSHIQERRFACSICHKLFKTQHSLKVHLRTHSDLNPYKCPVCNNQFRERGSLQRHMRLHTGEKPFKCHLCNRAFSEKGTLSRHLKAKVPCTANRGLTTAPPRLEGVASTAVGLFSDAPIDKRVPPTPVGLFSDTAINSDNQHLTVHGASGEQKLQSPAGLDGQEFLAEAEIGSGFVVLKSSEDPTNVTESVVSTMVTDVDIAGDINQEMPLGEMETVHIVDPTTGEDVIIVADKSVVELVRSQYLALQDGTSDGSNNSGGGLALEQILLAVRNGSAPGASQQEMIGQQIALLESTSLAVEDDEDKKEITRPTNCLQDQGTEQVTEKVKSEIIEVEELPIADK